MCDFFFFEKLDFFTRYYYHFYYDHNLYFTIITYCYLLGYHYYYKFLCGTITTEESLHIFEIAEQGYYLYIRCNLYEMY